MSKDHKVLLSTLFTLLLFSTFGISAFGSIKVASAAPSMGVATIYHDRSHPVKANYPCTNTSRSGIVPIGQEPVFNCSTAQRQYTQIGIQPLASNPAGQCINGTAYLQTLSNGHGQLWAGTSDTKSTNSYDAGYGMTGWIEYYWCPTPSDPNNGINWSYGEVYPRATVGGNCPGMYVGGPVSNSIYYAYNFTEGGDIVYVVGTDNYAIGDNENYHGWTICPGNAVYDYSSIGSGSQKYTAEIMIGEWADANYLTSNIDIRWPYAQ